MNQLETAPQPIRSAEDYPAVLRDQLLENKEQMVLWDSVLMKCGLVYLFSGRPMLLLALYITPLVDAIEARGMVNVQLLDTREQYSYVLTPEWVRHLKGPLSKG